MRFAPVSLAFLIAPVVLAACGEARVAYPEREDIYRNPLYVYAENSLRVQYITNLEMKEPSMSGALKTPKLQALRAAQDSQTIIQEGWLGTFVRGVDDEVTGGVVLVDGWLHIGPSFVMAPGIDVRVYLTKAIDPLEGAFPDDTAIEVGPLVKALGLQSLPLDESIPLDGTYRTVVLYDRELNRLLGFAQLEKAE